MALPLYAGRYQLNELLGRGGMGVVYRATDLRTGGAVAVKVIAPALAADPAYLERLRREARITASLTSPRVVRVIDLDEHDGAPFLVLEYVAGPTLDQLLAAQGSFSAHEAVRICLEVARALEAAHARGIVHRDLKPDNIKLADGQVKVLDFGIARSEAESGVTLTGGYLGTPHYSAPERIGGHSDIRSDIYALGAILFKLVTGRPPYDGPTPVATLMKHATAPLPEELAQLPEPVRQIVVTCMAKSPTERYQTPADLVTALSRALRSLPPDDEAERDDRGSTATGGREATPLAPTLPVVTPTEHPSAAETTPLPRGWAAPGTPTTTAGHTLSAGSAATDERAGGTATGRTSPRLLWAAGGISVVLVAVIAALVLALRSGGEESSADAPPPTIVYHPWAGSSQVTTLTGNGERGIVDGPPDVARLLYPVGVTVGRDGTVYLIDGGRVRRVSPTGDLITLAGAEEEGFVDGVAVSARFDTPKGIAIDAAGTLYIADRENNRIRTLSPQGVVRTLAGNGEAGLADGPGAQAQFNYPSDVAVDAAGIVYVADSYNDRIRRIGPDGTVSTLAGGGDGDVLNGPAAQVSFSFPRGIAVDAAGTVYVADSYNSRIRTISPDGIVRTLAGSGESAADDGPAANATFPSPLALALDAAGNVYLLDESNRVRLITPDGQVSTIAGDGTGDWVDGAGEAARFDQPSSIAIGPDGRIYIADTDNYRIRVLTLPR